jgi:hypothetical protein
MARESGIRAQIKRHLEKLGATVRVRHTSRFSLTGDPDLFGSYRGRAFVLEVKQPNGRVRPLQYVRLREWDRSKTITGIVRSVEEAVYVVTRKKRLYGVRKS